MSVIIYETVYALLLFFDKFKELFFLGTHNAGSAVVGLIEHLAVDAGSSFSDVVATYRCWFWLVLVSPMLGAG
jgi:hypothetical protein